MLEHITGAAGYEATRFEQESSWKKTEKLKTGSRSDPVFLFVCCGVQRTGLEQSHAA
jgi:hypothetical protein